MRAAQAVFAPSAGDNAYCRFLAGAPMCKNKKEDESVQLRHDHLLTKTLVRYPLLTRTQSKTQILKV